MSLGLVRLVAGATMVAALVSCVGQDFERPAQSSLVLGETTKVELLAQVGEPYRIEAQNHNGQPVEHLTYVFGATLASSVFVPYNVSPDARAKALGLYFHDGVLVGYQFVSNFDADSTVFEPEKIRTLNDGGSCTQIETLFGPAPGLLKYPVTDSREGIVYSYRYTYRKASVFGGNIYIRTLAVTCDGNGNIAKVEHTDLRA